MTEQERLEKNERIRRTRQETLSRRANQTCTVYQVKIDNSRLSKKQLEELRMLFVEAKWIYNDILNFSEKNDIRLYDPLKKVVMVKNKNGEFEERPLRFIGSQMKQSILAQTLSSIKALSTLKKRKKQTPGKLKFTANYTSLNLKKYENCYQFYSKNTLRIQGVSGRVKVFGADQFINDKTIEFANAKVLNTPKGYYVNITIYRNKGGETQQYLPKIGIDMGIKMMIRTSNVEDSPINVMIEETERLKKLQRKLTKQKKGSNNYNKTRHKIQKEYQKLSDRKTDMANKIVSKLLSHEVVYMQDEQLSTWKRKYGKKVQHSALGRIKAKLVRSEHVVVLDRRVPTTKYCHECHTLHKDITSPDRVFICPNCGYKEDRDINAAQNMIIMAKEGYPLKDVKDKAANAKLVALYKVPTGRREFTPVEIESSTSTTVSNFEMIVEVRSIGETGRSHPLG